MRRIAVAVRSIAGLDDELPAWHEQLTAAEQARAGRLQVGGQQERFVVGRALMRSVVARIGGVSASDVVIEIAPSGRPVVAAPRGVYASAAHSGDLVVAAAAARPVGIDVERIESARIESRVGSARTDSARVDSARVDSARVDSVHTDSPGIRSALVERVCSPAEVAALDALPPNEKRAAFIAIWVRKEAYGKALGVGLDFELRSVTAGPAGGRIAGGRGDWRVCELPVGPDYVAAVVAGGRWMPLRLDVQRLG